MIPNRPLFRQSLDPERVRGGMKPKTPARRSRWKSLGPASAVVPGGRVFRRRHLQVISAIKAGEWHVSVSSLRMGTVSDENLELVREDFGMQGAVEERGALRGRRVRHLWPALELAG